MVLPRPRPAEDERSDGDESAVPCAYPDVRWEQTRAAVEFVLGQHPRSAQVLVSAGHNTDLATRPRRDLAGVSVLASNGAPGLSGAGNAGRRVVSQPIAALLDDDAEARPGWLASLIEPHSDSDEVAYRGSVHPRRPDLRQLWLPPVFDWVIGCSYPGLLDSVVTWPTRLA